MSVIPKTANVPLGAIELTGWNPRKHFDQAKLKELTESIREHGVLQPILLRPTPGSSNGDYQLVAGERRFRAAQAAGLKKIPATVRALSDREVLEIMLSENLQRADLHPLEEADAYQQLHKEHGYTVEELAAKAGKSRAYVYARMRLCALPARVKKYFLEGKLDAARANLIARIHNAKLAEEAAAEIVGEEMTAAEASRHIRDRFMLKLAGAQFPAGDADLVKAAGACADCPKRSGAQSDLFGEAAEKDDLCLDPVCFRKKIDAASARKVEEARKRGVPVLPKGEARQVFHAHAHDDGVRYGSAYVSPKREDWGLAGGKTYKAALGNDAPPVTIAVNPHTGLVVELYRKDDVERVLKGKQGKRAKGASERAADAARSQQREKERVNAEIRRRLVAQLVSTAEASEPEGFWKAMAEGAIARAWHDTLKGVAARREISTKGRKGANRGMGGVLNEHAKGLSVEQLRGLAVEVVVGAFVRPDDTWKEGRLRSQAILAAFGIDPKPIEAAVRKEFAAKAKTPAKSPTRKAKEPAKGNTKRKPLKQSSPDSVRRCRVCGCTDDDCRQCIEKTGEPCHWVEKDLCSACVNEEHEHGES